jgi:predicted RNA-binding Zn-ribbon protein involved in translation (DUF1610 family)
MALQSRQPLRRRVASMEFVCPQCERVLLLRTDDARSEKGLVRCTDCGLDLGIPAQDLREDVPVTRCLLCGSRDLYSARDFNPYLGFVVLLGSFSLVVLVALMVDWILGLLCAGILGSMTFLSYRLVASLTACYLCRSLYRGFPSNPALGRRYPGHEEKYRALREGWVERVLESSRRQDAGTPAGKPGVLE